MYLRKFTFRENEGQKIEWLIDDVHLGKINLIVGKNSSGKTRTLNALSELVDFLTGIRHVPKIQGHYRVVFIHEEKEVELLLDYASGVITREELIWQGEQVLERNKEGKGWILYMGNKEPIRLDFGIPVQTPACYAKRDKLQHPFLEVIYTWANHVRRFNFSGDLGKNAYELKSAFEDIEEINFQDTNNSLVPVLSLGLMQYPTFRETILHDMREIGYDLVDLGITHISEKHHSGQDRYGVYTTESGLEKQVTQRDMSQGMFRAFSVLVRLNRYIESGNSGCIIIDDIGEGLDFSRAKLLVNLLVRKAESSGIQLIMSTNDSFIMNAVDIENWAVMQREGNKIHLYNYENSKEIFEDFKFTGLNNFDFYASEFFKSGFSEDDK
jgi:predicted ATPase